MDRLRLMFAHRSILGIAAGIVAGIVLVANAGLPWLRALALLGQTAQMLNENNLPHFIFHLKPPRRQWQFDLLYRAHFGHHDFPTNRALVFASGFVVFPVLAINFTAVCGLLTLAGADESVFGFTLN